MNRAKNHLLLFIFLSTIFCKKAKAQITHGVTFQIGLINSLYKSQLSDKQNNATLFLPTYSFEYGKYSDNLFWGGCGLGIHVRNIPFYKYSDGNVMGLQAPEIWFKVKTGLHLHREFLTHLPYISLGIGTYGAKEKYFKSQNGVSYNNVGNYKQFNLQRYLPFMEIGTTLINSTFTENKRNIYLTFNIRYYPLSIFKSPTDIEFYPDEIATIQYKLIEFTIIAGIQKNFHK